MNNRPTLGHALAWGKQQLCSASHPLDAEILLAHCLSQDRSYLLAHDDEILLLTDWQHYQTFIQQCAQGLPIAYLTGVKEFWSLPLRVNPYTLIPRSDTECLVETALCLLARDQALEIVDMGTGSGAIALALASECPDWQISASDCCQHALALATENAQTLQLQKLQFFQGDWYQALPEASRFDAIISNPPYLSAEDPHLSTLQFEPRTALIAQDQGFAALHTLIDGAFAKLKPNGWLMIEHGWDQANACHARLAACGFQAIGHSLDLAGHHRVSYGQKPHDKQ